MIRVTHEAGKLLCVADVAERFSVYLDTDSLIELAKDCTGRRERFLTALKTGGNLMFSQTNAAEIGGPKGDSSRAVRSFLESIGNNWVPLELNPFAVVRREQNGEFSLAPISQMLMEAYVEQRYRELVRESQILDTTAESFFSLATFVDWLQDRDEIVSEAAAMDRALLDNVKKARTMYERDRSSLDRHFPPVLYDAQHRATFALNHLFRLLVLEFKAYRLNRNDGLDLCHAVMAAAYSNLATLDKHWKRRVEMLPKPNGLARIFYRPQVDQLVTALETVIDKSDSKKLGDFNG